jgi:hypothetical protein
MLEVHQDKFLPRVTSVLTDRGYSITINNTVSRGPGTYHVYGSRYDTMDMISGDFSLPTLPINPSITTHSPLTVYELYDYVREAGVTMPLTIAIVEKLPQDNPTGVVSLTRNFFANDISLSTKTEQDLTVIAAQILGATDIKPHDNLLELGKGFSTLIRIAVQIYQQYHIELPLEFMYSGPYTIHEIASVIDRQLAQKLQAHSK